MLLFDDSGTDGHQLFLVISLIGVSGEGSTVDLHTHAKVPPLAFMAA